MSDIKRFIFSGTSGSGKTSVLVEIEKLGHVAIHEAATDIIMRENNRGNINS